MRKSWISLIALVPLSIGRAAAQTPPEGPEFQVNTYTTGPQRGPSASIAPNGNSIVVWESYGQAGASVEAIYGQRLDEFGQPQGGEFQVNTNTASYSSNQYLGPSVSSDSSGNFIVVWTSASDGNGLGIAGQRFNSSGVPQGSEFQVNATTTGNQFNAQVAMSPSGSFVVVWQGPDQDSYGVFGQRFDASGTPQGSQFQANTTTALAQYLPSVAAASDGSFTVVWDSIVGSGQYANVVTGRRYDSSGNPIGGEFQVNADTSTYQYLPKVALDGLGNFAVVWANSGAPDGSGSAVLGRRFDNTGNALGTPFVVNTYSTGYQYGSSLAMDSTGNFVVTWSSYLQDGSKGGVYGQRYDSTGRPVGAEFQVNTYTTDYQWFSSVGLNDSGNFVTAWQSYGQDGSNYGVFGKRMEFKAAQPMAVDKHAGTGTSSNLNGVLEPGETVQVEPAWLNTVTVPLTFTATASNLTGPAGPTYTINDSSADYGTIAVGATGDCYDATADCYIVTVSGTRPTAHWDATFLETATGAPITKVWTLHVGESFPDVPTSDTFYAFIENLFHNGITGGCGGGNYCPTNSVTRAQMAVFLLKAEHGSSYVPPPCAGIFGDVPCPSAFADWIEQLSAEGITGGCGGGDYCPNNPVTRAQMAVFLLKAEHGSSYAPPMCTGIFPDVTCPSAFANWIEQLYNEGITGGCGGGNYCPDNPNTRGQMAVFLVKTFGLVLYGP